MMTNNTEYKKKQLHRPLTVHSSVVHLYAQSVPKNQPCCQNQTQYSASMGSCLIHQSFEAPPQKHIQLYHDKSMSVSNVLNVQLDTSAGRVLQCYTLCVIVCIFISIYILSISFNHFQYCLLFLQCQLTGKMALNIILLRYQDCRSVNNNVTLVTVYRHITVLIKALLASCNCSLLPKYLTLIISLVIFKHLLLLCCFIQINTYFIMHSLAVKYD